MPTFSLDHFRVEQQSAVGGAEPDQTLWISESGGLTQFGVFIEVLQPGDRSSIRHWHSDEDELVYVLEDEITMIDCCIPERDAGSILFGSVRRSHSKLNVRCSLLRDFLQNLEERTV